MKAGESKRTGTMGHGDFARDMQDRLLGFAVRVGKVVDALPDTRLGRHVAGQLVRCGTAAGPNYAEGCVAESRADFVHKLGICRKELNETPFWLRLAAEADLVPRPKIDPLAEEADHLTRLLSQSVLTARRNAPARRRSPPA